MQSTFTKYSLLILIALFLASICELSEQECCQNYESENHEYVCCPSLILPALKVQHMIPAKVLWQPALPALGGIAPFAQSQVVPPHPIAHLNHKLYLFESALLI